MGLFTAISIPAETAAGFEHLRSGLHGARWVEAEAYHITLSYMGELDGADIVRLIEALDPVRFDAFEISLKGLGIFGGNRPRALWAGVEDSTGLKAFQARQARAIIQTGFKLERRKYAPHMTLARFRDCNRGDLQQFAARQNLFSAAPFIVDGYALLSSRPNMGGGPYDCEAEFSGQAGFLPDMGQQPV